MTEIIKHLSGYSGSKVTLMQDSQEIFVRKSGQNSRNLERIAALSSIELPVPRILRIDSETYDMEYIHHTSIANWLAHNHIGSLMEWLLEVFDKLQEKSTLKDYKPVYSAKLDQLTQYGWYDNLPFSTEQLIQRLPRYLPQSQYHGDFTLDNCLHSVDGTFYLIDPLTTEYDSWVFDLAKIMQDLQCGWFIRNKNFYLHSKLWAVRKGLLERYPNTYTPELLILMLMRVLPYAHNDLDREFLTREIQKLWK